MAGTTDSSSSRTWSSGRGSAKPTASRTTFRRSKGMPVRALSWWKGRVGESREPIERGHIHEGERQRSVSDGGDHPLERHAGPLQALYPTRPEHVSRRERVSGAGPQDSQVDQSVDVVGVDPGAMSDLLPRVSAHASASIAPGPQPPAGSVLTVARVLSPVKTPSGRDRRGGGVGILSPLPPMGQAIPAPIV
jgi:hypothetical protein